MAHSSADRPLVMFMSGHTLSHSQEHMLLLPFKHVDGQRAKWEEYGAFLETRLVEGSIKPGQLNDGTNVGPSTSFLNRILRVTKIHPKIKIKTVSMLELQHIHHIYERILRLH